MGLVISKRHRPDSPFASQCHSIVLQPRLPVSPLLSASTHTRSTLQGFRSRIAPQTALSLSLPASLPVSSRLHTAPLHRGAIGLGIVVVPRRHRARAEKRRANRPSFFARPPPSHSLYREEAGRCSPSRTRTGHRVASRFFSRTFSIQERQSLFVVQFGEEGNSPKLCGIERRKGGRKRGVWSFYGNLIRNGDCKSIQNF